MLLSPVAPLGSLCPWHWALPRGRAPTDCSNGRSPSDPFLLAQLTEAPEEPAGRERGRLAVQCLVSLSSGAPQVTAQRGGPLHSTLAPPAPSAAVSIAPGTALGPGGPLYPAQNFGLNSLQIAHFEFTSCFPPAPASSRHLWREARHPPAAAPPGDGRTCLPSRPTHPAQGGDPPRSHSRCRTKARAAARALF